MDFSQFCDTLHLSGSEEIAQQLYASFKASDFFAAALIKYPTLVETIDWHVLDNQNSLNAKISTLFAQENVSDNALGKDLRILRKHVSLKLLFQHQHNIASFEHIAFVLSFTAKQILIYAEKFLASGLSGEYQLTSSVPPLLIIAMGKLGGNELNFSSDIDLIFLYDCEQAFLCRNGKTISNQQFYIRLGQRLIGLLNDTTADGFVYRVDMRLRPFGEGAPLVISVENFERYLLEHARDWERYAYVKADIISGESQSITRLRKKITDFVYRHYLDYKMISSLRTMKHMIIKEIKAKQLHNNIKLGYGGIREIEFISQCFQLVYGGKNKGLQTTSIKEALFVLAHAKHITDDDAQLLYKNYIFLRDLENSLQMLDDQQIHTLPCQKKQQQQIVKLMGLSGYDMLQSEISAVQASVQQYFDQLTQFSALEKTQQNNNPNTKKVTTSNEYKPNFISPITDKFFEKNQFNDPEKDIIIALFNAIKSVKGAEFITEIMPLIQVLARRKNYLYLMGEAKQHLTDFVKFLSHGARIPALLAKYPFLLECALFSKAHKEIYLNMDELRYALNDELQKIDCSDTELYLETLRQFKIKQIFNIIIAEWNHTISMMESSDLFSYLATIIIESVLQRAWRDVFLTGQLSKKTQKTYIDALAVIAYGKLGGFELSLASDLDLVFLSDHHAAKLEQSIFVRVIQKFIHYMQIQTYNGKLYDIDLRLRPNGKDGLLISNFSAYQKYLLQSAWTWEHQSLTRSRFIIGRNHTQIKFNKLRHQVIAQARQPKHLKTEICQMRDKMRAHLLKTHAEFDLKQSVGGMVDIEFIAQFFALAYSHKIPQMCFYSDSIRIIETAESANIISLETAKTLITSYCLYRQLSFQCYLNRQPSIVSFDKVMPHSKEVRQIWHHVFQ